MSSLIDDESVNSRSGVVTGRLQALRAGLVRPPGAAPSGQQEPLSPGTSVSIVKAAVAASSPGSDRIMLVTWKKRWHFNVYFRRKNVGFILKSRFN